MFEVGWTEMLVIAVVMIVVVGPKDLPNMLRTFGRTTSKLRAMAADFQKQFNEALKEAELDDVKKSVDTLRGLNPATEIRKQLNPFEQAAADVRAGVDTMMKPKPAADPAQEAAATPEAAEPLKNGATEMPGINGAEVTPATPTFPVMTDASVTAPVSEIAKPAEPAKKAATSKAKTAPGVAKATTAKAPVAAASAKASPAAKAATPAKKAAPKAEPKAVATVRKPAVKKPSDAKKTAGAAK
ncbi:MULTISPECIES: Sec-independent protein translocase protein TatB [unclassified Mesorhizobium]|uniref:Sec-independent protein translocase protein TatB n=1 Tax=unclassified Mesorhizobium TaxID=325217 RepID=UPI000BAF7443|nr:MULTISPECIES: Sec-independent protein translocase protein TatB [unclassified Mesorhizobium]TGT59496.1 twin-arginine translocase subunit TatB [Mesorhizobium sp. M00.F.Ca.ET.170.01.1.1]AZO12490.1 twin-arginine translocase subunit TatB [Mesorhizobium sp. M3A.F.Ca.ET.080.04.2.1]PBB85984.1 twin-arginine translocase subunit TatB [Mesorhizobium sp. WSM3876]RWB68389.1 MAG: twin-arginine translocase subunit TatB [Mesorhizobium sp.]RWB85883.1 MAG: twin-arginine translocase subunit TatB [Mesorhizobium